MYNVFPHALRCTRYVIVGATAVKLEVLWTKIFGSLLSVGCPNEKCYHIRKDMQQAALKICVDFSLVRYLQRCKTIAVDWMQKKGLAISEQCRQVYKYFFPSTMLLFP